MNSLSAERADASPISDIRSTIRNPYPTQVSTPSRGYTSVYRRKTIFDLLAQRTDNDNGKNNITFCRASMPKHALSEFIISWNEPSISYKTILSSYTESY